jgi:hypothetical protein
MGSRRQILLSNLSSSVEVRGKASAVADWSTDLLAGFRKRDDGHEQPLRVAGWWETRRRISVVDARRRLLCCGAPGANRSCGR